MCNLVEEATAKAGRKSQRVKTDSFQPYTPQDLEPTSSSLLQPQDLYNLMIQFFTRCESLPEECIGQRPLPVCLHLFGNLKSRVEETIRIIFAYECFCRRTVARELLCPRAADLRQEARVDADATIMDLCNSTTWPDTLRAISPQLAAATSASRRGIFLTQSQVEQLHNRVRTIHSSHLDEHVQLICDQPKCIYILLPGGF